MNLIEKSIIIKILTQNLIRFIDALNHGSDLSFGDFFDLFDSSKW